MDQPTARQLADLFTADEKASIREAAASGRGRSEGLSRDAALAILEERADAAGYDIGRGNLRNVVNDLRGNPEASISKDRRSLEDESAGGEPAERRTYKEKGDTAEVTLLTAQSVKTLDDLLDACEMDGTVWEVLDWESSAWNSVVKDDGVETGPLGKTDFKVASPRIAQLFRVKARFRRKVFERDFIRDTGEKRRVEGAKRPSALYRLAEGQAVFDRRL